MRHQWYNITMFDPGGVTGWTWMMIDFRAFMNRDASVMDHVYHWDTGEYDGKREWQITSAANLVQYARYWEDPFSIVDIVSEDFELMQTVGGNDLLLPVEWNAVMEWECSRRFGLPLQKQKRSLRTQWTKDRVKRLGFSWTGKDSFASMQHTIAWLKRQKEISKRNPQRWMESKIRPAFKV